MTDDRLTEYQSEATERIPTRRSPTSRPAPIPVRRGQLNTPGDPGDAHTEELPVMSDEEFEAIQAAAARRAKGEPEPVAAQPEPEPAAPAKPRRRTLLGG